MRLGGESTRYLGEGRGSIERCWAFESTQEFNMFRYEADIFYINFSYSVPYLQTLLSMFYHFWTG